MWFRTIYSKTLRDELPAILGWGLGLALLVSITYGVYAASNSAAAMENLAQIAQTFKFIGEPVAIRTGPGFITWRTFSFIPLLLSIWTLLVGARMLRREEERGALDVLLATPKSRTRVGFEKIAAFATALVAIAVLITLGGVVGEASARVDIDFGRMLLTGLNVSLLAFFYGTLALLLAQFTSGRAAARWTGLLLALSWLMDGTARTVPHAEWVGRLSPFFYYGLSKPLIPTYGVNAGAVLVLLVLSLVLAGASVLLFRWRDIGATALPAINIRRSPAHVTNDMALDQAVRDITVRTIGLRALGAEGGTIFWWLFGLALYAAWTVSIARSTKDQIASFYASSPSLSSLLKGTSLGSDAGFVQLTLFLLLPVALAIFTLLQAMDWVQDAESGRLDVMLSTPLRRQRVYFERLATVVAAVLLAPLVTGLVVLATARGVNLSIDAGHLAVSMVGLVPLELIVAALTFMLAGWLRAGAVLGILSALLGISFFADVLADLLHVPDWLISLSIFHQYGTPLVGAAHWSAWLVITALAAVLSALGAVRFRQADMRHG